MSQSVNDSLNRPLQPTFLKGADVSFLQEIEEKGGRFYDDNDSATGDDCLRILARNGINSIRLRVWNNPPQGYCNLKRTLEMAQRVKALGMRLLIDFHYSDSWADPGKQFKPAAWTELSFAELTEAVYEYTFDVLQQLKDQGTSPDMVQIGNEITYGMLWEEGRVSGPGLTGSAEPILSLAEANVDADAAWERLGQLVSAGILATRRCLGEETEVMIHIDRGGDNAGSRHFLDNLLAQGVRFDCLGLSYYPWWHGTVEAFSHNLRDLAARYDMDVILVETAYPWAENDVIHDAMAKHSIVASVLEQKRFLQQILQIVAEVPERRGRGVFYWEPDWIPTDTTAGESGSEAADASTNGWHRLALFGLNGNALDGLRAFNEFQIV